MTESAPLQDLLCRFQEKKYAESIRETLQRLIWKAVGMDSTGCLWEPRTAIRPVFYHADHTPYDEDIFRVGLHKNISMSLYTTLPDLSRFYQEMLRAYSGKSAVISRQAANALFAPEIK
jgi:CubicO group peptidase (beta-lactamase class C family)